MAGTLQAYEMDARDLSMFLTGAAALKYWQWTTRRDRPRNAIEELMARKMLAARFARVARRWAAARERVTGRKYAPGAEEDAARHWAWRVPRMWL
jgi:hypothetical protein